MNCGSTIEEQVEPLLPNTTAIDYASRLSCLYRGTSYIIVTKKGMQEGNYDDKLLKFLFQLEPENF